MEEFRAMSNAHPELLPPQLKRTIIDYDYAESKQLVKVPRKLLNIDKGRDTVKMDMLKNWRQLHHHSYKLQKKRITYKTHITRFNKKWVQLAKDELSLRDTFKNCDMYCEENVEKRKRSYKRIQNERRLIEKLRVKQNILKDKNEYLASLKERLEKEVDKIKFYEQFLQNAVKYIGNFKEVSDIMQRYAEITYVKDNAFKQRGNIYSQLEDANTKLAQLVEENRLKTALLFQKVLSLTKRYSTFRENTLYWENIVAALRNRMHEREQSLEAVQNSANSLYFTMCREMNIKPLKNLTTNEQITFIGRKLEMIEQIVDKLTRPEKRAKRKMFNKVHKYTTTSTSQMSYLNKADNADKSKKRVQRTSGLSHLSADASDKSGMSLDKSLLSEGRRSSKVTYSLSDSKTTQGTSASGSDKSLSRRINISAASRV